MTALLQVSITPPPFNSIRYYTCTKPFHFRHLPSSKVASFDRKRFKLRAFPETWRSLGAVRRRVKREILVKDEGWKSTGKRRVVLVRFNQGFDGGGAGGGGRDDKGTVRLLGNIALAIGFTYLSVTGQLGWFFDAVAYVFDAIISLWLLVVFAAILGSGAFLWWAARDIVQSTCPNCGNEFQIFKSTLNDELQLCPFCSQPFSVVDDKFVRGSVKFSKESTTFGQAFSDFYPGSKKGKDSSSAVVDVEAEVKDVE